MSGVGGIAEYVDREVSDRARHARAIEVQGRQIGGPDVFPSVHLHARKDRKKVFSAKLITRHRPRQCTSHEMARTPVIKRLDLPTPPGQSRELVFDWPVAIGDVVD